MGRERSEHQSDFLALTFPSDALRVVVAGLLWVSGPGMGLGEENPRLFFGVGLAYLSAAVVLAVVRGWWVERLQWATSKGVTELQVMWSMAASVVDGTAITLLMAVSGGFSSGLPLVLFLVGTATAFERPPRLALFGAAVGVVGLLGENGWRLWEERGGADPWWVGVTGAGLLTTAWLAASVGGRVRASEAALAFERALLAWQQEVNDRIVAELGDGVVWVGADRRIRYASPRVVAWLGRDPVGERVEQVLPVGVQPGEERWWVRADGCWRFVGGREDSAGEWLVWMSDLAAAARHFQRERLAALGLLVAGVAHELRNPLAGIAQALDLLRDASEEERAEWLGVAERNVARIGRLIEEVLALGRLRPPEPRGVALREWLREWRARLPPAEARRVAVEGDEGEAWVDPDHLERVVENLVKNGLAFASQREGAVRVTVVSEGAEWCALQVTDDGPGVAPEVERALFSPFVSGRTGGIGLGLFLVQELVRLNGGEVYYQRGEEGGAVFTVRWRQRGME
ncbi:MAG: ATP-binding protein [Hydrogenophilus sp.]|nr:ATP-binding protein [Hydrogenophilus sp.]